MHVAREIESTYLKLSKKKNYKKAAEKIKLLLLDKSVSKRKSINR